jgi:hypothetical protein
MLACGTLFLLGSFKPGINTDEKSFFASATDHLLAMSLILLHAATTFASIQVSTSLNLSSSTLTVEQNKLDRLSWGLLASLVQLWRCQVSTSIRPAVGGN